MDRHPQIGEASVGHDETGHRYWYTAEDRQPAQPFREATIGQKGYTEDGHRYTKQKGQDAGEAYLNLSNRESGKEENFGSSAEFVGKTVFHRRLRRPRCSPSLKASLASSAAAPALTLGCAPRCRLVWAMGNGASGGGSGHRV